MSVTLDIQAVRLIEQLEKVSKQTESSKINHTRKLTSNFLLRARRFQELHHWGWGQIFQSQVVLDRIKQNSELTKTFIKPLLIFLELHPYAKKQHPRRVEICESLQSYLENYNTKIVQKVEKAPIKEKVKHKVIESPIAEPKKAVIVAGTQNHQVDLDHLDPLYILPLVIVQSECHDPKPHSSPAPLVQVPSHCDGNNSSHHQDHSHHTAIALPSHTDHSTTHHTESFPTPSFEYTSANNHGHDYGNSNVNYDYGSSHTTSYEHSCTFDSNNY